MQCPSCGDETPEGKRFCANCGTVLTQACSQCGAELLAGKRFCADCGTPVSAAASTAQTTDGLSGSAEPPTAERRLCSVMFVDLVGFTPLAEKRDPEEIRELLSRYFDRAQIIVDNYGGTVEKFIGDAVMAVWGAPTANEDDAERAVRAALDIVASVGELGREANLEGLAARGGIVTGEVAITIGKVSEGMVLGDTVNSASRVQSAAKPGTVLVDEGTWRASSGAIAFEEFGDLNLKGKEIVVKAWRAIRVVGKRKGLGRSERLEPPFVGRDDELRLIKDLLHATAREQRARLVSVTGVPGIGKSRLAWEFLKYIDGLADDVYWHRGRSASYGEGVTFGALGEMIRMRAGINDVEDNATARQKLAASVAEFVADDEERRWIEPKLAHLLGLADTPGGDREELFNAWRTFFERVSSFGLTVMVFEDLQWADPGLIDFVESILEWSRSYPIMVVTLSRPELRDLRPDWGAGQRSFTSLHLDPLSLDAMRALLDGFVHGLPETVTDSVLTRAEGVPLYAVETVRMLVDRGVLVEDDGIYRVEGEFSMLEIPETLHALVASRLDALPTEQRALLQDAAVLGTNFLPESLLAIHGGERSNLDAHLRDLVRKEFLSFDSDPRSPERGQYGFVQGVIGEVAVGMLSRRDRCAKHLVAAKYYESFEDDELTAIVAAHYAAAHRAAPEGPEADDIAVHASAWLARAGNRAVSLGSPEQALELYNQALEITPEGPGRATLLESASEAAINTGDHEKAVALLQAALAIHEVSLDKTAIGMVTAKIAEEFANLNRREESISLAEQAYEAADEDQYEVRCRLALAISNSTSHGLNEPRALEWAEVALALSERLDDTTLLARALGSRSFALFNLGRHREAVMLARGMVSLALEVGSLREQARATLGLSLYALPDDPHETFTVALESAEIARRAGLRGIEETNLMNAAETAIGLGLWDQSRAMLKELGTRVIRKQTTEWLACLNAMLLALSGDAQGARSMIEMSADLEQETFVSSVTTILHSNAMVRYAAGEFAEAHELAARAVAMDPVGINSSVSLAMQARSSIQLRRIDEVEEAFEAAHLIRGRWMAAARAEMEAALAALRGDFDQASDLYTVAIDAWRALNCNLDVAITELELVHLMSPGHPSVVAAKEAKDFLTQIGAAPLLAWLEADLER
ncbi:MAG: adenylate/guanylate cyclase domain-containing protein [Acidimicrobiales bacterium]